MLLALGLVPIFLVGISTQEPASPAILQLSLEEVVLLVAEQAPALAQARLLGMASDGGVLEASGAFDPVLFADVTYSFAESPAAGFFSAFGTTKIRRYDANQGIRKALTTGGSLSLALRESYNDASFLPNAAICLNVILTILRASLL